MSEQQIREAIASEVIRLLSAERKKKGLSLNRLAEKSGLSQSLLSGLEAGPWNPTLDSLLRISEVLEVNLGDVVKKAIRNSAL